jgi:hypothetical protein
MNDDTDVKRYLIEPLTTLGPVFAKPMHLSTVPLSSPLTFSVKDHNGNLIDNWQIFYVRKPVPTSIWGAYNSSVDPNLVDARTASDGVRTATNTVEHAMALSIHSPPPKLSKTPIPPFNATAASRLQIPRAIIRDEHKVAIALPWQLPPPEPVQRTGLPGEEFESEKRPADQWTDVKNVWNTAFNRDLVGDKNGGMLAFTAALLGWDQPPVIGTADLATSSASSGVEPNHWELVGGVPEVLVGDDRDPEKGLEEYYLALPRMSDGCGALGLTFLDTGDGARTVQTHA